MHTPCDEVIDFNIVAVEEDSKYIQVFSNWNSKLMLFFLAASLSLPYDSIEGLKPPQMLCMDSNNLSKTWKNWWDEFDLYVGLAIAEADDKQKVKLLRYPVGESGRVLLDSLIGDIAKDSWKIVGHHQKVITLPQQEQDCQTLLFLQEKPGHQ